MQAMRLKEILETDMIVRLDVDDNSLSVGSEYIPNLITIDLNNMRMCYTMGIYHTDRSEISSQNLLGIWDKLQSLIDDGTLHEIISKDDVVDNPATVYRVIDGELKSFEATGDSFPHTLLNGELIYNNVYFKNPCDALISGYSENCLTINYNNREINELSERLKVLRAEIDDSKKANINILNNELPKLLKTIDKADIETITIPDCMLNLLMEGRNVRIREDVTESLHALYKKRKTGIIVQVTGETITPAAPVYAFFMHNDQNGESKNSGVTLAYIKNEE